jgi:hypothetical protein
MDSAKPGDFSLGEQEGPLACLEHRVQRLEAAVTALQEKTCPESADKPQVKVGPAMANSTNIMAGNPPEPVDGPPAEPAPSSRPPWLLVDILAEAKAMVQMFFDIRYRVGWFTRLLVVILLTLIFTSGLWFPPAYLPLLGTPLEKILDVLLAFVTYKVLSREARRYRAVQSER